MTSNLQGRVDSSTLSIRYMRNGVWYETTGIEAIVNILNDTQLGDIVAFVNQDEAKNV